MYSLSGFYKIETYIFEMLPEWFCQKFSWRYPVYIQTQSGHLYMNIFFDRL